MPCLANLIFIFALVHTLWLPVMCRPSVTCGSITFLGDNLGDNFRQLGNALAVILVHLRVYVEVDNGGNPHRPTKLQSFIVDMQGVWIGRD